MSEAILEAIRKAENLPSIPNVAIEVLRLCRSDDVSVNQLGEVIQNDPALTAKLLKLVNSPLFRVSREVTSVKQAMVSLGLRTVKVMALSFSVVDAIQGTATEDFDYEAYWKRSLTTSVAARLIGKAVAPRLADEAFVAGLLSDLGMVAAWRCAPALYLPVLQAWSSRQKPLHVLETEMLGLSHAAMGWELMKSWGLPELLCVAVAAHHGEGLAKLSGPSLEMAKLVHTAAEVAGVFCSDVTPDKLKAVKAECRSMTGIKESVLEAVLGEIDKHVRDTAFLLALPVGATVNYAQLQIDAAHQIARLSMQGEVERAKIAQREAQARHDVDRLQEEKKAILEVASTDGLTKIANRACFDKRLAEELDRARANHHPLALILMDVDHFKKFNDIYGHQAGDEVLRGMGQCLRDVAEKCGFVARYGGEEFAVILARQTADVVQALAQEIRTTIESRTIRHEDRALRVTASLGAAWVEPGRTAISGKELIAKADALLYQAKHNGRNRVELAPAGA